MRENKKISKKLRIDIVDTQFKQSRYYCWHFGFYKLKYQVAKKLGKTDFISRYMKSFEILKELFPKDEGFDVDGLTVDSAFLD